MRTPIGQSETGAKAKPTYTTLKGEAVGTAKGGRVEVKHTRVSPNDGTADYELFQIRNHKGATISVPVADKVALKEVKEAIVEQIDALL